MIDTRPSRSVAALFAATLCFSSWAKISPVRAAAFDARPVTIETHDGLGAVVITNPGDRKIYLEAQVFDWSEDAAGQNVLSESDTAIASPPATWVGPHSTYNIRVRLPKGAPDQERAFRVIIRQLPDHDDIVAGRVVFALTQSLPAFVEPGQAQPAKLRGQFVDSHHLLITNEGGKRARLANIRQDGRVVAPGLLGYALQHAGVANATTASFAPGAIDVETDAGHRIIDIR